MVDAVFVGYMDYGYGAHSEPLIAFKTTEDAIKWKNEAPYREFKLVEWR